MTLRNLPARVAGMLLALATSTVLLSPQALAQDAPKAIPDGDYRLGGITVQGNSQTDEESIVLLSGLVTGRKLTLPGNELPEAINKLWKQDLFNDVQIALDRIEGDGPVKQLFLTIRVQERPRITRYAIRGVRKGQETDLKEKIRIVTGTIFTEAKSRGAIRIIKNFYQEKGFYDVDVDVDLRPDTFLRRNGVQVVFTVDRGPRVKIRKLTIEGNEKFSDKLLERKLKKTKERKPWRFWKRSKFLRGDFNEDKDLLLTFLNEKGYRDAQILDDSVRPVRKGLIDLTIKMYEGRQYYFGDIDFVGNFKYDDDILMRMLSIKKGDVYDQSLLQTKLTGDPQKGDVGSLYQDDGYLFFRAVPEEVGIEGDTINLEIKITEGPQATINKLLIEGNDKTNEFVVRREIRTLPGEKFSRAQIIRSQREILALGFFDQQKLGIQPIPSPSGTTTDIRFTVEERSNDQITLQGGYGGITRDANGQRVGGGLLATVGLQFNNFSTRKILDRKAWRPLPSGDGQKLSLTVQTNGTNFQNYGITFLEPWFGGKKPNSLGFSTNYSIQQQQSSLSDYRIGILNLSVDYGRRLTWPDDFFRSFTSFRYANYDLRNAGNIFPTIQDGATGTVNVLSVRQTFDRTSIDAPIFSRSGSVLTLNLEATPPWTLLGRPLQGADNTLERFRLLEFYKIKLDAQTFLTVQSGKLPTVLYMRGRFGYLGSYDQDYGVSPLERFYLGGDGQQQFQLDGREIIGMRGYSTQFIGPTSGSTVYNKFTLELRQPITLEQSATVWVHGFLEAGNAWGPSDQFNPFNVRRSAGVGLRAFLPMFGLLGLDYGYGFDDVFSNGQNIGGQGRIHFILGQQF